MDNIELLNGLYEIYDKPFLSNLKTTIKKYPDVDFSDALSIGQIKSKNWLIDRLHWETCDGYLPGNGMIFIVGGWYGTLAAMMLEDRKYVFSSSSNFHNMKIRSFDWDPECAPIADSINNTWVQNNWQFKAITEDMYEINYNEHTWQVWSNKNNRMSKPFKELSSDFNFVISPFIILTLFFSKCEISDIDEFEKLSKIVTSWSDKDCTK